MNIVLIVMLFILFFLTLRRINLIDKDAEQSGEQRKEEPDDPAPTD